VEAATASAPFQTTSARVYLDFESGKNEKSVAPFGATLDKVSLGKWEKPFAFHYLRRE